jgi:FtsP/CotA-like multicopper oxidase with cupredoxin domain
MVLEELREIQWFDKEIVANYTQRVVNIDNLRYKMFTINNLQPGSFGVKVKVGKKLKILIKNNLPYKKGICDSSFEELPMANQNPTWVNNHFHGVFTSGYQDDVYACVLPNKELLYKFNINPIHPTGIYIDHNHNFNSSVYLDNVTTFPIHVYGDKPDYPLPSTVLFLQLGYMSPCTCPECEYEVVDFPAFAEKPFDELAEVVKESKKLLLTNGYVAPYKICRKNEPVIFRIAWMGIMDTLRFCILDDMDEKVEFRILNIDSMPIPNDNKFIRTEYLAAHMQRFDILLFFRKETQYRLMKIQNEEENLNPLAGGEHVLLYVNIESSNIKELKLEKFHYRSNEWINYINSHFRNKKNIIAYRNMRFNYPEFPMMEGAMFDKSALTENQLTLVCNRSEIWYVASFNDVHSLHIHMTWFLILAERKNGNLPWNIIPAYSQWFQDTLTIESNQEYVVWMFSFADKRVKKVERAIGRGMVHCHNTDHSDSMMMLSLLFDDSKNAVPLGVGLQPGPQSEEIVKIVEKSVL